MVEPSATPSSSRYPLTVSPTSARNVPLYERHGFRAIGVIRSGSSPPIVPMVRPPVTASA